MSLDDMLILEQRLISETGMELDSRTEHRNCATTTATEIFSADGPSARSQTPAECDTSIAAASWTARLLKALAGGSILRKSALALVDQGIVSAVNFLTIVMLRRVEAGSAEGVDHELGLYQLGFSIVLLGACVQNAIVSTPYSVFVHRLRGRERKQYAGSTLVHQGMLSGVMIVTLLVVGLVLAVGWQGSTFDGVALTLAGMIPFLMTREFVRRLAFVHLQVVTALLLDSAVAVMQLGGLWALKSAGLLTATTTFCTMGLACAVAGFSALFVLRDCFELRQIKPWPDFRLNWSFGKWAFASQVVYLGMAYSPSWMLAILSSTRATGRFAVGMSLVMITNPLLIGLYNFLGPQAIYAFHTNGRVALRRFTIRTGALITIVVSVVYALLIMFSGNLLAAFFGAKVQGQEQVVSILAVSMVMYALAMSAENGLTSLNMPAVVFWSNAIGLIMLVATGWVLIADHGIVGAALAVLVGATVASGLKISWFFRASSAKMDS